MNLVKFLELALKGLLIELEKNKTKKRLKGDKEYQMKDKDIGTSNHTKELVKLFLKLII